MNDAAIADTAGTALEAAEHVLVGSGNKLLGVANARDGLRALLAAGNQEEELLRDHVMGMGYQ